MPLRTVRLEDRATPAIFTVTNTANSGAGSLRKALADAAALPGPDTIDFAANLAGDIIRLTNDIAIADADGVSVKGGKTITVSGDGDADGSADTRLFTITAGSNVTLTGLSLAKGNGQAVGTSNGLGGALYNAGTLTVSNCTISGSTADTGGGIYNAGKLTVTSNSTVNKCSATGYGGGIYNAGTLSVVNSTISNCSGSTGGGLSSGSSFNTAAVLDVVSSTITGNTAGYGAGIYNGGKMTVGGTSAVSKCTALYDGGGIYNAGSATVTTTTITGNTAFVGGGIANGGAVSTGAVLEVTGSTISGNFADFGGGVANADTATLTNCTVADNLGPAAAPATYGGGVYNSGNLTVSGSTISGSTADYGGGIYNISILNLVNTTVTKCAAGYYGGGIYNAGTMTVAGSTISANNAFVGGGVANGGSFVTTAVLDIAGSTIVGNAASFGGGASNNGTMTVANSTISGNTGPAAAPADYGGGVYSVSALTVTSSTVTGNSAIVGGGIYTYGTGATLVSTIVAGNGTDIVGPVQLLESQFNLIGEAASAAGLVHGNNNNIVGNAGTGTIPIANILLPLANNGGPTLTHALAANSPAINAGSNPLALATDQRGTGFVRQAGSAPDIGAFEVQAVTPAKLTSLTVADGTAQRSNVTSLKLTFDQAVTFTGSAVAAFTLARSGPTTPPFSPATGPVTLDAAVAGNVVTLTFNGSLTETGTKSLIDGLYNLTIVASAFAGNGFDGNNDGTAGDNYSLTGSKANGLFRLFGDSDGNGTVNFTDFLAFRTAFGTGGASAFDFNGDNQVNFTDFLAFRTRFGVSI